MTMHAAAGAPRLALGSLRRMVPLAALMLGGGNALAAEAPLDRARQCAAIQDSLQRLVCYDRVSPPTAGADTGTPAADQASSDTARFGAEGLKRSDAEREADSPPRSIAATVREVRETRPNVYRVTLDNGQIWQQMDMDSTFSIAVGDTVRIDRGRLGGYQLTRTS